MRNSGPLAVASEACCLNVVLKVSLKIMVAGHAVFLAAFFVQADPQAPVLPVNVRHGHAEGRADAGEGENQQADQRPLAQADDGRSVELSRSWRASGAASTGVLPLIGRLRATGHAVILGLAGVELCPLFGVLCRSA